MLQMKAKLTFDCLMKLFLRLKLRKNSLFDGTFCDFFLERDDKNMTKVSNFNLCDYLIGNSQKMQI